MKTILTLLLIAYSSIALSQKSDTMVIVSSLFNDGEMIIYTVGDVYKYASDNGNPWKDTVFHYIRVDDVDNGWIKYTRAETIDRLDNNPHLIDKRRDFYKLYQKRNKWEIIFTDK